MTVKNAREAHFTERTSITVGHSKIRMLSMDGHEDYPHSSDTSFGKMLGRSVVMRQVFVMLERAAASEVTLLLEGESGTGKDLAAETVHNHSVRNKGPFVVVDCGNMQSNLMESELFGHRKGAFTGAASDRVGAFEAANGGTVFLDEIGELDPSLQPKLLRLLENKKVKRLGENNYRSVNVRLIAATNRDLETEMTAGRFRQDLFYRLSVFRVRIPALRDRREDIGQLAMNIVKSLKPDLDPFSIPTEQRLALLVNYDWPGNVRELRNVVERLLIFPESLEKAIPSAGDGIVNDAQDVMDLPFHEARTKWIEWFEKAYLSTTLDACQGVVTQAAKKADIPRQTFYRLMHKHQLVKL